MTATLSSVALNRFLPFELKCKLQLFLSLGPIGLHSGTILWTLLGLQLAVADPYILLVLFLQESKTLSLTERKDSYKSQEETKHCII